MDKELESNFDNYQYLIKRFGKDKIASRYAWIHDLLNDYVVQLEYEDKVVISSDILNHVVVDYFVDIDRLKEFHRDILKVNNCKIYAYMSFWVLRHKPIQIKNAEDAADFVFINEEFVCALLRSYLFMEPSDVPILSNQQERVDDFFKTLLYYFQYREFSAKSIEIAIMAFDAGRGYQYSAEHQI